MKRNLIHILVASSTLSLVAIGGITAFVHKDKMEKVEAYTHEDSCPTTIDLNDCTESQIRSYYSSLNNLSASERQGTNLLKNLKGILSNGQKYWSYDASSGSYIWQMYEITDRDWDKSPASALTSSQGTYNSSTNKITNYKYGENYSNPYVHSLYTNRNVTNQAKAWGDHTQTNWGINREHVWAKSHGFGADGTMTTSGGARGDPMHLMAGNGKVNNGHSNYFFGFVNTSSSYTDYGNSLSYCAGNYLGTSLNKGSGTVFEPQDSDKGDIARACFYMAARYNNYDGDTAIDANNPNLRLVDVSTDSNGTTKYDSTSSKTGNMGIIRDLLAWNRLDPPDEYEIHRNNLLYKNFTNNRNPFIDFPEWAEFIWGKSTLATNNRNITSYSSSSTGSADPTGNAVNSFGSSVAPTSITLNASSASIGVGGTFQASVSSVSPTNASPSVTWSSNKTNIATVDNSGLITGVAAGSATITATSTLNTSVKKTISVTVSTVSVTSISVSPTTLELAVGDTSTLVPSYLPSNATAPTYTWSSNNTAVATVSGGTVTAVATGTATITVSDGNGHTATCTVAVVASASPYVNGIAYKFYMNVNSAKNYFNGSTSSSYSYYGATSTTYSNGVYVYFETNGSGQNMYYFDSTNNNAKTYVSIVISGSYKNFNIRTDNPDYVWLYDSTNNAIYADISGTAYYLGIKTGKTYTTFGALSAEDIGIYMYVEEATAEVFSYKFLNKITCDESGEEIPQFDDGYAWNNFSTLYTSLADTSEKNSLKNATANESGTIIQKAMARYDYICTKYGNSAYNNFIGRSSANAAKASIFKIQDNTIFVTIVIAVSMSSLFVGIYWYLKRKNRVTQ